MNSLQPYGWFINKRAEHLRDQMHALPWRISDSKNPNENDLPLPDDIKDILVNGFKSLIQGFHAAAQMSASVPLDRKYSKRAEAANEIVKALSKHTIFRKYKGDKTKALTNMLGWVIEAAVAAATDIDIPLPGVDSAYVKFPAHKDSFCISFA